MTVTRSVVRYHGGKWRIAPWIIAHFPAHLVYTEVFGGGASVLLRKQRVGTEVYNDLDGEMCNLFRVLRDPARARELIRLLTLTPYARCEYEDSKLPTGDPIEQARRTLVRSFMGHGSVSTTANSGFRQGSRPNSISAGQDWMGLPASLTPAIERLRGVIVEQRPAIDVLRQYDHPQALHYADPPYPMSVRNTHAASNCIYRHELSDDDHRELAKVLRGLQGKVVISGYPCDLYDKELYPDWQRVTRKAKADSGANRVEVLWISPSAVIRPQLF